jgi:hypothetical protein
LNEGQACTNMYILDVKRVLASSSNMHHAEMMRVSSVSDNLKSDFDLPDLTQIVPKLHGRWI